MFPQRNKFWSVIYAAVLLVCMSSCETKHRAPVLDLDDPEASYIGSIHENKGGIIIVKPAIQIKPKTGPVCTYSLRSFHNGGETNIPFQVEVLDKETGKAELRTKPGAKFDCEEQKEYKLSLVAVRCAGDDGVSVQSDAATLKVRVEDENEFSPEFSEKWYETTVDEGRIYDRIVKLDASDADCSNKFSEICRYEITNNVSPFTIDSSGVIRNTAPLDRERSHSYILTVVAHDCGMRQSEPVLVTVNVRRRCDLGWQNASERLDYSPGSKAQTIWPSASLDLCDIECGTAESVNASLVLHSEHIGRGCDRDSATVINQHKLCGADEKTLSLLPGQPSEEATKDGKPVTGSLSRVPKDEGDETYFFDGRNNAIIVSPEAVKPVMPSNFTLTFWMKHDKHAKQSKHQKENILCTSDDHKLNRHHFAIFVRNCKLEMLFRREFDKKLQNNFRPAEWRWVLPQVCDGQWHQYVLTVDFPEAHMLVDGRKFVETNDNFEILDDWPMHATKDLKTRLVVGACWHGRTGKMAQFFNGYLAGMMFLPDKVEPNSVLQCLHMCRESLDFQKGLTDLKPGMEAIFNHEMTEVTLKAKDLAGIEEMVSHVAYINTREDPTPGHRSVSLDTVVKCKDVETPITVPSVKSTVIVKEVPLPELTVSGTTSLTSTSEQVSHGLNIFPDFKITVKYPDGAVQKLPSNELVLDWCRISVIPVLNKDHEYFSSPAALISALHVDFQHVKEGLILKGSEKLKGYEEVLEQVHYFNLKPSIYATRVFSIDCSMMKEKVLSNRLAVSLAIVDSAPIVKEKVETLDEADAKEAPKPTTTEEKLPHSVIADKIVATLLHESGEGDRRDKDDKLDPGSEPSSKAAASNEHLDEGPPKTDTAVLHNEDPVPLQAHRSVNKPSFGPVPLINEADASAVLSNSGAGSAVAIVVVICVGFLLLLIVVGVMKLRSTSGRRKHNGELAWDDSGSGLNITVNPMEDVDAESGRMKEVLNDGSDYSSDDGDSYRDDDDDDDFDEDDSDEGEEESVLPHVNGTRGTQSNGLEWDDSTLHNGHPLHGRSSQNTYRV